MLVNFTRLAMTRGAQIRGTRAALIATLISVFTLSTAALAAPAVAKAPARSYIVQSSSAAAAGRAVQAAAALLDCTM